MGSLNSETVARELIAGTCNASLFAARTGFRRHAQCGLQSKPTNSQAIFALRVLLFPALRAIIIAVRRLKKSVGKIS